MSDNLRRYRAICHALTQAYPTPPTGPFARHLQTLAALMSGIVGGKSTQLPHIATKVPDGSKPESRVKRFARWLDNDRILEEMSFLPYAEILLDCCDLAKERRTSSRHDRLLLGEQIAKNIFHPLPELEVLVGIQDHGLHECLGLLTTRFPNGFDGQAPFRR